MNRIRLAAYFIFTILAISYSIIASNWVALGLCFVTLTLIWLRDQEILNSERSYRKN